MQWPAVGVPGGWIQHMVRRASISPQMVEKSGR